MKRWFILAIVLLLGGAAIFWSERRKVDVPAGPAAVLYLIADTEQELTRMPAHFMRMSDADEIAIGNQIARSYERGYQDNDPEHAEVRHYVERVGALLATHAHRKLPYRFHYVPDPGFVNAFALPGGHVYIGAGLLPLYGQRRPTRRRPRARNRAHRSLSLRGALAGGAGLATDSAGRVTCLFRSEFSRPVTVKTRNWKPTARGLGFPWKLDTLRSGAIRMFETFQRLYHEVHARAKTPQDELSQSPSTPCKDISARTLCLRSGSRKLTE